MDALIASYGDSSSDSDHESESSLVISHNNPTSSSSSSSPLPPPPLSLLTPPNSLPIFSTLDDLETGQPNRVRSFPHVDGNYALHVYIPVHVPQPSRKEAAQFLRKISLSIAGLHVVDADVPLCNLLNNDQKFEQIALGREFHISLGRTVPIRVHQIDSIVAMLRQKLQSQKRFWIDFSKWVVFVNDDGTRTFVSIEVTTGGLSEITKQIQAVNEVYRLHNLPEFYKNPRPHISLAWALGDVSDSLQRAVEETMKRANSGPTRAFTIKFSGIECKDGISEELCSDVICQPPPEVITVTTLYHPSFSMSM